MQIVKGRGGKGRKGVVDNVAGTLTAITKLCGVVCAVRRLVHKKGRSSNTP